MAHQRLGQHFLADLDWREQIARAIRVSPHSTVPLPRDDQHCWIEIGAGNGEMTRHLLAAGGPVTAIELDPKLASRLEHLAKERSEEHTSELQSHSDLVCRLLLEKKKKNR